MHFIWVPAIIAMCLSAVSVLVRLCDIALLWRSRPREVNRQRLLRLLRPGLIVLVVAALGARERMAQYLSESRYHKAYPDPRAGPSGSRSQSGIPDG